MTIFKAMGRERSTLRSAIFDLPKMILTELGPVATENTENCDKCGRLIFAGDWPWCRGERSDHER